MRLRYTSGALRQIETTLAHVAERSPQGAVRLGDRIVALTGLLLQHPLAGQMTDRPGVRRLVLNPFPYLIFYRIVGDDVIVMRFRHAVRDKEGSD